MGWVKGKLLQKSMF